VSYEMADLILEMLVDEKKPLSEVKKKFPPNIVERLATSIFASEHKRTPPPAIEI
jgi:NH3-dependent NAD+ synthetase